MGFGVVTPIMTPRMFHLPSKWMALHPPEVGERGLLHGQRTLSADFVVALRPLPTESLRARGSTNTPSMSTYRNSAAGGVNVVFLVARPLY